MVFPLPGEQNTDPYLDLLRIQEFWTFGDHGPPLVCEAGGVTSKYSALGQLGWTALPTLG